MDPLLHPAAPHSLPWFITAPGQTDSLMNFALIFLILVVLFVGSLYLHLHSLPERISHGRRQHQFELVAVLALIALFTHNAFFWFAALLLALVRIPDFTSPIESMAQSLARMAGGGNAPPEPPVAPPQADDPPVSAEPAPGDDQAEKV